MNLDNGLSGPNPSKHITDDKGVCHSDQDHGFDERKGAASVGKLLLREHG
jgi:hypothetical protein